MKNFVPRQSRILDADCGSGLTGTALRNLGHGNIEGIDISAKLLALADQTGAYDRVERVNMQTFPLPFEDSEFDVHHPEYGSRIKVRYFVYEVL